MIILQMYQIQRFMYSGIFFFKLRNKFFAFFFVDIIILYNIRISVTYIMRMTIFLHIFVFKSIAAPYLSAFAFCSLTLMFYFSCCTKGNVDTSTPSAHPPQRPTPPGSIGMFFSGVLISPPKNSIISQNTFKKIIFFLFSFYEYFSNVTVTEFVNECKYSFQNPSRNQLILGYCLLKSILMYQLSCLMCNLNNNYFNNYY